MSTNWRWFGLCTPWTLGLFTIKTTGTLGRVNMNELGWNQTLLGHISKNLKRDVAILVMEFK